MPITQTRKAWQTKCPKKITILGPVIVFLVWNMFLLLIKRKRENKKSGSLQKQSIGRSE
jgi:hypothetical protein